jgi:hypothetical protein
MSIFARITFCDIGVPFKPCVMTQRQVTSGLEVGYEYVDLSLTRHWCHKAELCGASMPDK